jgi:hypothetical protein
MRFPLSIVVCLLLLGVCSPVAWAAGEYELNDTRDTAFGPLSGGVPYTATFETENDNDWYVFYIKTYSQMDFSASAVGASTCNRADFDLLDKDGKQINGFDSGFLNETEHLMVTLPAGRYYFEVQSNDFAGCNGDRYTFRIDPAAAITPSRDCGEAIVAKESVGPQLAKVAGELAKNSEKLAGPNREVSADEARLAALDKRWEEFLAKWKSTVRKLSKRRAIPGYVRRQKMRSLLAAKKRTNLRSKSMKDSAKRDLAADQKVQASVLAQRAGLQAVEAQAKATQSQAEAQMASSC